MIIIGAPDSAIEKDLKKRHPEFVKTVQPPPENTILRNVLAEKFAETLLFPLTILSVSSPELHDFYMSEIVLTFEQAVHIAEQTLYQKCIHWRYARKKRITASRAYSLFTYNKNKHPDWTQKISKYVFPAVVQTKAVQYGTYTEPLARACYEQQERCTVLQIGLLVNPSAPWLGYSPDSYVVDADKIFEIKCPLLGETCPLKMVLPSLKYLTDTFQLKKKNDYYCQIQIGMAVLNCKNCDFIIYSKFEIACYILHVPFDISYFLDIIIVLEKTYFKYILPMLPDNCTQHTTGSK